MLQSARMTPAQRPWVYLMVALILIGMGALHTYQFRDRNYRQDEVYTAHASAFRSPADVVQWMAGDIHPPLWRVLGVAWAASFTQNESITRFLSVLLAALAVAATFRLGADLFGWRAGVIAALLLATLPFFQFYAHEFRPYAGLLFTTAAMQLALWRWLRRHTFGRALAFVAAGIALIYTHYLGVVALAGTVAATALLVRLRVGTVVRGAGLLVAIALSYIGWFPILLTVLFERRPYGVTYALDGDADTLRGLHERLQLQPVGLGLFLAAVALLTPVVMLWRFHQPPSAAARERDRMVFRFGSESRRWYVGLYVMLTLGAVLIVNTRWSILTERNLSIVMPAYIICLSYALLVLSSHLRRIALLVVVVVSLMPLPVYLTSQPFRQVLAAMQPTYQPGDLFVLNINAVSHSSATRFYLQDRLLPNTDEARERFEADAFAIISDIDRFNDLLPDGTTWFDDNLNRFTTFVERGGEQLFWLQHRQPNLTRPEHEQVVAARYVLVETTQIRNDGSLPGRYEVRRYRRIPPFETVYQFGGALTLGHWRLLNDVQVAPCQTVTLESWWRADERLPENYSLTLVLADTQGIGVANSDGEPAGILTRLWTPGQAYLDTRTLTVPCDAAPGEYPLLIGLYDYDTVESLSVTLADGAPVAGFGYLTTLFIP